MFALICNSVLGLSNSDLMLVVLVVVLIQHIIRLLKHGSLQIIHDLGFEIILESFQKLIACYEYPYPTE